MALFDIESALRTEKYEFDVRCVSIILCEYIKLCRER